MKRMILVAAALLIGCQTIPEYAAQQCAAHRHNQQVYAQCFNATVEQQQRSRYMMGKALYDYGQQQSTNVPHAPSFRCRTWTVGAQTYTDCK